MEKYGRVGFVVTTFELDRPVLTHIFWGKDWDEAFRRAKAHLKSDSYFAASFREFETLSNEYAFDFEPELELSACEFRARIRALRL